MSVNATQYAISKKILTKRMYFLTDDWAIVLWMVILFFDWWLSNCFMDGYSIFWLMTEQLFYGWLFYFLTDDWAIVLWMVILFFDWWLSNCFMDGYSIFWLMTEQLFYGWLFHIRGFCLKVCLAIMFNYGPKAMPAS